MKNNNISLDLIRYAARMERAMPDDSIGNWTQTGEQKGIFPGGFYKDISGNEWYVKFYETDDQIRNELLVNKLYKLAGVPVPDVKLIENDGSKRGSSIGIASKIIQNARPSNYDDEQLMIKDYIVDNWLMVEDQHSDNIFIANDDAYRIDAGSSLLYYDVFRLKDADIMREEMDDLKDYLLSEEEVDAVKRISNIPDKQIKEYVEEYGPSNRNLQKMAYSQLRKRKNVIKKMKPYVDDSNDYVNRTDYTKPLIKIKPMNKRNGLDIDLDGDIDIPRINEDVMSDSLNIKMHRALPVMPPSLVSLSFGGKSRPKPPGFMPRMPGQRRRR